MMDVVYQTSNRTQLSFLLVEPSQTVLSHGATAQESQKQSTTFRGRDKQRLVVTVNGQVLAA